MVHDIKRDLLDDSNAAANYGMDNILELWQKKKRETGHDQDLHKLNFHLRLSWA